MKCPSSLVFNETKGYCDYPDEECTSVASNSYRPPIGTVHLQTPSVQPFDTSKSYCKGKENGYYSNGCSNEFVSCVKGDAIVMNCPPQLVFNNKKGYCDYIESCSGGGEVHQTQIAPTTPATAQTPKILSRSVHCEGKKEGYYAIQCSSEFVYCSNEGVATYMKCPSALVFNEKNGYCDYPESCSETAKQQSHPLEQLVQNTTVHHIDCSTLPDGRYGSHCSTTFTVCFNGVSTSMKCVNELVFDAKNNKCSLIHECDKQDASQNTLLEAPQYFTTKVSSTECMNKTDGLHSLGCISVFLQCVSGIAYNVYCPTGLVFVENLGVCDVPSACSQHQNHKVASAPTSYEAVIGNANNDSEYEAECDIDGYFSRKCSPQYFNCVGGKLFVGMCPEGMVFNVEKVYCDTPKSCLRGGLDFNPDAQAVPTTILDERFSCQHRADGVVKDLDCQPKFTTCLNGTAFITSCPNGLIYSVTAKLCDRPESCELKSDTNTLSGIRPSSNTFLPHSTSTISPKSYALPDLASVKYYDTVVGVHLCSNGVDKPLNSTNCRHSFSFCAHGSLYSIRCADGLLYSFASRRCELPSVCRGHLKDVVSSAPPVKDSSISNECIASIALGNCLSEFERCKEGKLITAYCPEQSLFDNDLLLCVYDMPKCQRSSPTTQNPLEATKAAEFLTTSPIYAVPVVPVNRPYPSQYFSSISRQGYHTFDRSMGNPFAKSSPEYVLFAVHDSIHDSMFGGGKVSQGPINFEERSVLLGNRRQKVLDVYDGYVSPWLWHGIDHVFVPNPYKRHKHRNSGSHSDEEYDVSGPFDDEQLNFYDLANEGKVDHVGEDEFNDDDTLEGGVNSAEHKDQIIEGSGEKMLLRKRRNSQNDKMREFPMCIPSSSPGFVAVGFCKQDFVFCRSVDTGVLAACPVGDLFDNSSKKCVTSTLCGKTESLSSLQHKVPQYKTTSEQHVIITSGNKQACVESSDYALDCNGNFMKCVHGHFQPMKCPEGLVFDRLNHYCNYAYAVESCKGELGRIKHNMKYPTDRTSTGDAISNTVVESSKIKTSGTHKESSTEPQNPLSTVAARFSNISCPTHPQPIARCSSKFLLCSRGIYRELYCTKPLVFNPVTMACDYREVVPECRNFEEEASTRSNAALSCVYNEKRPVIALDFCGRTYGVCSVQGIMKREECNVGFLFDSHLDTCVPTEQCGQERLKDLLKKMMPTPPNFGVQATESSFNSEKRKDDRCRNTAEGALKPLGRCRSSYIRCVDSKAIIEPCSTTAEVFSSAVGMCVMRINAPECHDKPQRKYLPQSASSDDPTTFCKSRTDGLYRNPADCTGILQCFGGDVFEYPSCSSGLVFNEQTGKCDYKDSVLECRVDAADSSLLKGCHGATHGDFVADESNCQQFYRCVWNRLERMQCPSGTVFNPELSICDWPVNVPQCANQTSSIKQ